MPNHLTRRTTLSLGLGAMGALALPGGAHAAPIPFDGSWEHLTFRSLKPNSFTASGGSVRVTSQGTSSIFYRILPQALFSSRSAQWSWRVNSSVPPSDLNNPDNDDRNLGVFFVNASDDLAARVRPGTSISRLLRSRDVQVLMYTWGGNHPKGAVIPSPQARDRLRNIVMRGAAPGEFSESVDLAADFRRAFGVEMANLVAVAVSSNSENSGQTVDATVSNWTVS